MKKNEYSLFTAVGMIVGVVIGSGIFFKSDNILVATNGSIALGVLVFSIAALGIVFGSLTVSELASRTSKAGGIITYMEDAYSKSVACAMGWFHTFLYYPSLVAVISWVSGIYICMLFGLNSTLELQIIIGLAIMIGAYTINVLSARLGGLFQSASTIIKIIPLILIAIAGVLFGNPSTFVLSDVTNMESFSWIAAIAPIAFSFDGWIIATSMSHEIKDSKRNLPRALVMAPLFILAIYLLYFVGISMYIGPETVISLGDAHVDLVANNLFGPFGAKIVLTFVVISILGTVNGVVMGHIRLPYSLAIRGMFPKYKTFSKVDEKLGMPVQSAIIAFSISFIWFLINYIILKFEILSNSDISEISITINYLLYILLYFKVFKMGLNNEVKGIWRGKINPMLAILGSLIILAGSISNSLFWINASISVAIFIAGIMFWKYQEKNGVIE